MNDPKIQALMQHTNPLQRQDKVQPDEDVLEYFNSPGKKEVGKLNAQRVPR